MRSYLLLLFLFLSMDVVAWQRLDTATLAEQAETLRLVDSFNNSMIYQRGIVKVAGEVATLNIPSGFKFLDAKQSRMVLHDVWGNPDDSTVLGMLFPEYGAPIADESYAFIVSYEEIGYVKDEDADDIDYDEMAKQIREEEPETNKLREKEGYASIHFVDWAQKPFYDKERKVLHWAKHFQFGGSDVGTLNYDVRILGKKGILSLNAVATIDKLEMVKKEIPVVLNIPSFNKGYQYKDFDANTDKIAAYTIGGLVAGKVLAKAGFFVLILKFWKIILAALVAGFAGFRKFFKRKEKEYPAVMDPNYATDNDSALAETHVPDTTPTATEADRNTES